MVEVGICSVINLSAICVPNGDGESVKNQAP